jgi:hypothetical protein
MKVIACRLSSLSYEQLDVRVAYIGLYIVRWLTRIQKRVIDASFNVLVINGVINVYRIPNVRLNNVQYI